MYNHAPANYICPFCKLLAADTVDIKSQHSDIIMQNDNVAAFMASHQLPKNPGTVLIIPVKHYENIYDIPDDILAEIHILSKRISVAMRQVIADCKGNVMRQHNEPIEGAKCKGQDVFHYHLHIMPRYDTDQMYEYAEDGQRFLVSVEERKQYADRIRAVLNTA